MKEEKKSTVDIRGKICPYTLIETRNALKNLGDGEVLEVICDYKPAATHTIPEMCKKKGYPFELEEVEKDKLWKIYIKKEEVKNG